MDIIYHSHSFVEIILWNKSILIDPFISGNSLCDVSLEQVCSKNILAVIITHWHMDHIGNAIDIIKKTGCKLISTVEVVKYLKNQRSTLSSYSLNIGWKKELEYFKVKFVNAVHSWAIWIEGLAWKAAWVLIEINGKKIYHAWDTALTYDMKLLEDENIDLAFLPIWDNFTMWIEDGIKAIEFIKPKTVVPMHYNTFDNIKKDPMDFAQKIMLWNLSNCKVLGPWQYIVY